MKCEYCGKDTKNRKFCNYKCHGKYLHDKSVGENPIDTQLDLITSVTGKKILPRGTIAKVAISNGVSYQRVSQRAKLLHMETTIGDGKSNTCPVCGGDILKNQKRCRKHRGKYIMNGSWLKEQMKKEIFTLQELLDVFNLKYCHASNLKTSFKQNGIIERINHTNPAVYRIVERVTGNSIG